MWRGLDRPVFAEAQKTAHDYAIILPLLYQTCAHF